MSGSGLTGLLRDALRGTDEDHTRGLVRRSIILLAVPMMLEMAMEAVFAVTDIFFVAKLGSAAVAAVGMTEAVLTLVYAVAIGLSAATTAMVARRIGEGDEHGAAIASAQALWIGAFVSGVIGIVGVTLAEQILAWLGADDEVIKSASYTKILLGGSASITYIFLINAIFRGAGDASIAMRSLMLANGINIVLDPLLIFGIGPFPELGVTGAAVATTTGRSIGVLYQLLLLGGGNQRVTLRWRDLGIVPQVMRRLLVLSANGILQFFFATSAWIVLMALVARSGTAAVAGYTIAMRIVEFVILPAWGLGNAAATLVGQSLGAGKPSRAKLAVGITARYNFYFMASIGVVFIIIPHLFVRIFTDEPLVIEYGAACLRFLAYGYGFYALGMVMVQALNGAGDTFTPMLINLVCFWLIQLPLAWYLAETAGFGARGAFAAITIAESLIALLAWWAFRAGRWQRLQV
ncbi:MAG: MATE family efflux transporter [Gammaproteobacteria bacterium]|nr:MATE family efflux transporter [Gammaproteobacteria bacterium]NNF61567.1 MATE family efflux transporter [Gammaproteobacteria bacterium]